MNEGIFGVLPQTEIKENQVSKIHKFDKKQDVIPFSEKSQFEKTDEFTARLEKIFEQPLHSNWVKLYEKYYDADTEKFKFKIESKKWFKKHSLNIGELYILVDPKFAQLLSKQCVHYPLYVSFVVGKGDITGHCSDVEIGLTSIILSALETTFTVYQVEDDEAWEKAKRLNTKESYQDYLKGNTLKKYYKELEQIIQQKDREAKQILQKNQERLDEAEWKLARTKNTIESYQNYLKGNALNKLKRFKDEAQKKINMKRKMKYYREREKEWNEKGEKQDDILKIAIFISLIVLWIFFCFYLSGGEI